MSLKFRVLKGTMKNKVIIKLSDSFSEQIFGVHIKYDLVISAKLWPVLDYNLGPNYGSLIIQGTQLWVLDYTRDPTMGP